jgi:hypothetical protein
MGEERIHGGGGARDRLGVAAAGHLEQNGVDIGVAQLDAGEVVGAAPARQPSEHGRPPECQVGEIEPRT